jgi:hypothetical protein
LLTSGKFIAIDEANDDTYAFIREDETNGQRVFVLLNFARGEGRGKESTFKPDFDFSGAKLLLSNGDATEGSGIDGEIELGPWEGRIYLL